MKNYPLFENTNDQFDQMISTHNLPFREGIKIQNKTATFATAKTSAP